MRTRIVRHMLSVALLLLLSGCMTFNPLNISDEQWSRMTQAQQLKAYEQQAELDRARIEAAALQRQARIQAERKRQDALLARKQNARYGDLVQCVLEPLEVQYNNKWKPTQPIAFELVRGESQSLRFQNSSQKYSTTGWVLFQPDGQTLSLCRHRSDRTDSKQCTNILGTTKEFHRGLRKQIQINNFLKGQIRCDLKPIR